MKPLYETIGPNYSKKEFIQKCASDMKFFGEKVLNLQIMPFHLRWAEMFHTQPRSAILAARQIGKTTILGVCYPLWYLTFNKLLQKTHFDKKPARFLIVSNTMNESKRIIREQKTAIQNTEFLYNNLYPKTNREGKLWTKLEYQTLNGCSVITRAYSENLRGVGVHRLLLNESSLFRDYYIYERALLPIVGNTGNLCSIGTPLTETDVLAHQMRDPTYTTDKVPIITRGQPTWPWKYDQTSIDKLRKEMGELSFTREYMCEMVSDASQAIDKKSIIQCLNQDIKINTNLTPNGNPQLNQQHQLTIPYRVTGIDLAMSAQGDYSTSITLTQTPENKWQLEHIDRQRGLNFQQHLTWINHIYKAFQPSQIHIDKSQFGQGLIEELQTQHNIPAQPFKFTPENRKEAIGRMIQLIETQRLTIPYNQNCPYTRQHIDILIHELDSIIPSKTPSGIETYTTISRHDDLAMALAIAASLTHTQQTQTFHIRKWGDIPKPHTPPQ